jgi:hypothetical protein
MHYEQIFCTHAWPELTFTMNYFEVSKNCVRQVLRISRMSSIFGTYLP